MQFRLAAPVPIVIMAIIIAAAAAGGSYYAIFSTSSRPKPAILTWATNPLQITFPASARSGSQSDSFTCGSSLGQVFLVAKNNRPSILTLTVTPSSFNSCGSTGDKVVIVATCNESVSVARCRGSYTGTIRVMSPTPYNNLDNSSNNDNNNGTGNNNGNNNNSSTLSVIITVT